MKIMETSDKILAIGEISDEQCQEASLFVIPFADTSQNLAWKPRGGIVRLTVDEAKQLTGGFLFARPPASVDHDGSRRFDMLNHIIAGFTGASLQRHGFVVVCDADSLKVIQDDEASAGETIFEGYAANEYVLVKNELVKLDSASLRSQLSGRRA